MQHFLHFYIISLQIVINKETWVGNMIKKTEIGYHQMNLAFKEQIEKHKSEKKWNEKARTANRVDCRQAISLAESLSLFTPYLCIGATVRTGLPDEKSGQAVYGGSLNHGK